MIEKHMLRKLRVEIRHILITEWDPIGVSDEPMAADEYDGYIVPIFGMLERAASGAEIIEYLWWIEVVRMGLGEGDPLRCLAVRQKTTSLLQELWARSVSFS